MISELSFLIYDDYQRAAEYLFFCSYEFVTENPEFIWQREKVFKFCRSKQKQIKQITVTMSSSSNNLFLGGSRVGGVPLETSSKNEISLQTTILSWKWEKAHFCLQKKVVFCCKKLRTFVKFLLESSEHSNQNASLELSSWDKLALLFCLIISAPSNHSRVKRMKFFTNNLKYHDWHDAHI